MVRVVLGKGRGRGVHVGDGRRRTAAGYASSQRVWPSGYRLQWIDGVVRLRRAAAGLISQVVGDDQV